MNRGAWRALLGLALEDMVFLLRTSLDRNRTGAGHPSAVYQELADALDRFDRLGGFEELTLDLWRDELGTFGGSRSSANAERDRAGSDAQPAAGHWWAGLAPNRIERDRTGSDAQPAARVPRS
jgi:hypothetical protein